MDREFGRRVKTARAYRDEMSQGALAEKLSAQPGQTAVSASTVKRIESGDPGVKGDPQVWAERIAQATDVPLGFLLDGWEHAQVEAVVLSMPHDAKAIERMQKMIRALNEMAEGEPIMYYVDREEGLVYIGPADMPDPPGDPMTLEEMRALAREPEADAPLTPRDELGRDLSDDDPSPQSPEQNAPPAVGDGS
jgi:hypothetical protein